MNNLNELSLQELADTYVDAIMKFKFYEDAIYDQEEGTEEYENACALTNAWSEIMDKLEERLIKAASDEGLLVKSQFGIYNQIEPFINKYDCYFYGGWWMKSQKCLYTNITL